MEILATLSPFINVNPDKDASMDMSALAMGMFDPDVQDWNLTDDFVKRALWRTFRDFMMGNDPRPTCEVAGLAPAQS